MSISAALIAEMALFCVQDSRLTYSVHDLVGAGSVTQVKSLAARFEQFPLYGTQFPTRLRPQPYCVW
jgi:hypothetical protein